MPNRRSIPPAPDSSRIQIVTSDADRFVFVLPQGGRNARGFGCFAFFWLAITAGVSIPVLGSELGFFGPVKWEGDPPPPWGIGLFFSLFWAVGLGMAYAWLTMTFTRTLISLEPTRLAVQHELLGRKKLKLLDLDENSKAELVEAYSQNDSPVYRVAVSGIGREEKFGTALEVVEKEWLVTAINSFLGRTPQAADETSAEAEAANGGAYQSPNCPQCSAELRAISNGCVCDACGFLSDLPLAPSPAEQRSFPTFNGQGVVQTASVPELEPADLPTDSKLLVDESNLEAAKISYVAMPAGPIKYGIAGFLAVFVLLWFGGLLTFLSMGVKVVVDNGVVGPQLLFLIMPLFLIAAGMMPLAIFGAVAFGRVVILVNADWVRGRIQVGPFYKEKRIETSSIVDVGLGISSNFTTTVPTRGRSRTIVRRGPVAMIFSNQISLPLSLSSDAEFNRQLAGLVAYQLRQFGHAVPHE